MNRRAAIATILGTVGACLIPARLVKRLARPTLPGIDVTAPTRWRNWSATYVPITPETLAKIRRGMVLTDFRPPRECRGRLIAGAEQYQSR